MRPSSDRHRAFPYRRASASEPGNGAAPIAPAVELHFGVEHRGQVTIIEIGGELDIATCPRLEALLANALRGDESEVVVDLSLVAFMGGAGLHLLLDLAARVESTDRTFSIRGPSRAALRTFRAGSVSFPTESEAPEAVLVDLLAGLESSVTSEIIEAALDAVTAAGAGLPGVDASSVTALANGEAITVAASQSLSRLLDEVQYRSGGGPCVAASMTGEQVQITDTRTESRWPAFVEAAAAAGVVAVLSTPIGARGASVGALNLYSRTSHLGDKPAASAIASAADRVLALARYATPGVTASRLRTALDSRRTIAVALGSLMAQQGVGEADAYLMLGHRARQRGTSLHEEAAATLKRIVVADPEGQPDV